MTTPPPLHDYALSLVKSRDFCVLEHIFDINSVINGNGETLLQFALEHMSKDMFKFLIAKGIDLDHQDDDGNTILHTLVMKEPADVKELITIAIDNDIDVNVKNSRGMTAKIKPTISPNPKIY